MVLGFKKIPAILQNVSSLSSAPFCGPRRISDPGALAGFQQGLVQLGPGFQLIPQSLVSCQVSRDYHATAVVLPRNPAASCSPQKKCWRSLRRTQQPFHPASAPRCDQRPSGLLACPWSQHFMFSICSCPPGEPCCAIRGLVTVSHYPCQLPQATESSGSAGCSHVSMRVWGRRGSVSHASPAAASTSVLGHH